MMNYFDLFFSKSAIPFYQDNTIFFYDFIEKKRLKTIHLSGELIPFSNQKNDDILEQ